MKHYTFNKEKHVNSLMYKMSKGVCMLPIWLLIVFAVGFSILIGYMTNYCSLAVQKFVNREIEINEILDIYVVCNLVICLCVVFKFIFIKAFKLKMVNRRFMTEYKKIFKSKTADISKIGPAKIESSVQQIACDYADIWAMSLEVVKVAVPFSVTIYQIGRLNLYAAIGMIVLMTGAAIMSLVGDKLFHFNENAAHMKGEMRSVSLNNFIVVRMLKYMSAFKYAVKRQDSCQEEATPSMHNMARHLYNGAMSVFYNTPVLLGLAVAAVYKDAGLAVFVALNEWTITCIIDIVSNITETATDMSGTKKVIDILKGDDVPVEEKPAMPDHMVLKDVVFKYENTDIKFHIPEFTIEKGKRYRFASCSGAGKSSYFKYFAGEMKANREFDVRTFYIHQRTELLHDTVRNNITLGNQYVPDPVILELIKEVRLDKWYNALPNGLDTVIGGAIEPSGGEASRISLLRLFIHIRNYGVDGSHPDKNDVIILDEVTSALDKRDVFIKDDELSTEEAVIEVIDRETKGCTMFVISHEDVSSNAFGFKDIIDEQLVIDINGNDRVLRKMA